MTLLEDNTEFHLLGQTFEIPDLEIFEPTYHFQEILDQLKAEELGFTD